MKAFIRLFFILKLLIFCAILGQAANIQILPHKKLDRYKKIQFYKTINIQARRGRIYDRKEKELAINEPTYSVFADPQAVKSARLTSNKISKLLRANPKSLERKMNRQSRFVWLRRRVNLNIKNEIQNLKLPGLYFVSEPQRQYPGREVLSSVLGFVGSEGHGLEGLEYYYDDYLAGQDVALRVSRDAKGRPLSVNPEQYTNPPEGHDLMLTIDSEYQRFLEMQLKKIFNDHKPKRTYGLVMDTKTGAIRAAAQWPAYDANGSSAGRKNLGKNFLFHEAIEQGSTIKPIAVAAAIESGVFKPGSEFACLDGKIKLGRRSITDSKKLKCTSMTLTEGLKVSSNVVLTQMALGLGEEKMRRFYSNIGFGEKTEVDFPGESKGIFRTKKWTKHLLASASFGHGFTATPVQVATAYAAIANDGILNQPFMVDKIVSPSGLSTNIERHSKRVMSKSTAKILRAMLTEVTQPGGTGTKAAIEGYLVAGKTGTANKVDLTHGGYFQKKYLSSFVGMVPAEKPRFVIYIAVDEPQGKKYYGSEVAAPAFSEMARFMLNKEFIPPTNLLSQEILKCKPDECVYRPELKDKSETLMGLTLREALSFLKDKPVNFSFQGHGLVSKVIYTKGQSLEEGSRILIKLE